MQKKIISRCYDYYYLVKSIDANFRSDGAPVIPGLIRNPEISWMPDPSSRTRSGTGMTKSEFAKPTKFSNVFNTATELVIPATAERRAGNQELQQILDAGSVIPDLNRDRHDTRINHCFLALRHSFKSKKPERNNE